MEVRNGAVRARKQAWGVDRTWNKKERGPSGLLIKKNQMGICEYRIVGETVKRFLSPASQAILLLQPSLK